MLRIFNRTKIAILKIHGTIGSTVKYEQIYPLIRKIEKNKSVKSLIIDINSPGGGVTDSDLIFSALKKLNQKKPVISYVQGIGASGGYLIACSSNKIIASEASIVGSIGVISVRPMLVEFFKKIGIEVSVNKTGEFKDTGASWRKQTKKESEYLQEFINDYYSRFVEIVSKSRNLDLDHIKKIADGKIYWAPKAKDIGLIDEIGDINTAINYASNYTNSSKQTILFKPKVPILKKFFGNAANSFYEEFINKLSSEQIDLR